MDIEKQKEMKVYKAKELTDAMFDLDIDQQKMVLLYISMIRPEDSADDVKTIFLEDFCNLTTTSKYYIKDKMVSLQKNLAKKPIVITKKNGNILITNWFSSAEWIEDEKKLELTSDKKIRPYIFDLKQKLDGLYGNDDEKVIGMEQDSEFSGLYLSYPLKNVINLHKDYSIRLYEILRQRKKLGVLKIDLKVLRLSLGAYHGSLDLDDDGNLLKDPKFKYAPFGSFNRSILVCSQKELKEKTDIYFTFTPLKKGPKVITIKFLIFNNKNNTRLVTQGTFFNDDIPEIVEDDKDTGVVKLKKKPAVTKNFKIPKKIVSRVPKKQWKTKMGCKSILEEIYEESKDLEKVIFYIDYAIEYRDSKGNPAQSYGKIIRHAEKKLNSYDSEKEERIKQEAKIEAFRKKELTRYRELSDEDLYAAYKTGAKLAIDVWKEGRGAEIKAKRKENVSLDQLIKNLDKDPDMYENFQQYMINRKYELNKVRKQRFEEQIDAGKPIDLTIKRNFYSDFINSLETQ